jgi:metal-dependent amidase/aminoacylase/carboxypeptidase family protein
MTPAGPDALNVAATPDTITVGDPVVLTATINDTRFNNSNGAEPTQAIGDVAAEIVGESKLDRNKPPASASEDFAFMLEKVPGAYINLGNGESSAPVHNDRYDFNDDAIPFGAALFARLVEQRLEHSPGAL